MSNERSLAKIIILLAAAILSLGAFAFWKLDDYVRGQTEDRLARIANLQSGMFAAWWLERKGDANVLAADYSLGDAVAALRADPESMAMQQRLRDRLTVLLRNYPYKVASLYVPDGKVMIHQAAAGSVNSATARRLAVKAIADRQILVSEMHVEEFSDGVQTIDLDMAIPLRRNAAEDPVAVLALTINTEPFLNFSIRNSPILGDGVEVVLAQKNGEKVTVVNPRARTSGESLIYHRSLEDRDLPTARAARGERGLMNGIDYRGNRVTAFAHGIPNSEWVLVTKIDRNQTFSYQGNILLLVGLGVFTLSLLAYLYLRSRLAHSEASLLQLEVSARRQQDSLSSQITEANTKLQAILDNTPIGLAIIGLDRVIEQANAGFCDIFAIPKENLEGRSASILYATSDDFADLGKRAYPILLQGQVFDDVVPMQRRDGHSIWVRLTSRVIDSQGERPVAVWAAENVTEKRRIEEALRERERFYEDTFQSSAAVNLLIDPLALTILDCNESACRYYGYSPNILRGMPFARLTTLPDSELCSWIRQLCQHHSHETSRHRLANGDVRDVEIYVNRIYLRGQMRLLLVIHDITDRIASEEKVLKAHDALRRQKMELERSNADLEQFAYVASHDLRQPLRQISSFLGLLMRKYAPLLDEEGKTYVDFAHNGAKRMDALIVDLLEFSRIGRQQDSTEMVPLLETVQDALGNLGMALQECAATVTLPDAMPSVLGHRGELMRLWQNLLGNALKYRHPDRPCTVKIICDQHSDHVQIRICDNGIGIAPQYHEQIFGIFQRLHGVDHYEGTGIGLAVCRRILEHHHGRIGVESDGVSGSVFIVTLPMSAGTDGL